MAMPAAGLWSEMKGEACNLLEDSVSAQKKVRRMPLANWKGKFAVRSICDTGLGMMRNVRKGSMMVDARRKAAAAPSRRRQMGPMARIPMSDEAHSFTRKR